VGELEAIGSALHYGEYVVDAVKFMVDGGRVDRPARG
jgi:hypothetical protein